tara:strand:- start:6646 stop:7485 length:840 start_codon:yes stop_codon:yes gene_type:complete
LQIESKHVNVLLRKDKTMTQNRKGFIGGSDLYTILNGNWAELYDIKVGDKEPEDLSHIFKVQLGTFTEKFNINWFCKTTGLHAEYTQPLQIETIDGVPYRCTADALVRRKNTNEQFSILECKHVGGFQKTEDVIQTYMPQIQAYMRMWNVQYGYMSLIVGNNYAYHKIEFDSSYWNKLHTLVVRFWKHVVDKSRPETDASQEISIKDIKIDDLVARDASSENFFTEQSAIYIDMQDSAKRYEDAKLGLLSCLQDNEREVFNDVISVKRNKRGRRITIKD